MNYYHGSDKLFDKFDTKQSGTGLNAGKFLVTTYVRGIPMYNHSIIHLSPHKHYARSCAETLKERSGKGYIYEVSVKGQEDLIYKESMSNVCFNSDEGLTIISVEEI